MVLSVPHVPQDGSGLFVCLLALASHWTGCATIMSSSILFFLSDI